MSVIFIFVLLIPFYIQYWVTYDTPDKSRNIYVPPISEISNINLLNLLHERNYSELNTFLLRVQEGYESGSHDDTLPSRAYNIFANADPKHEPLLRDWIKAYPQSYLPYLVRGLYYMRLGITIRGEDSTFNTSANKFKRMENYHKLAFSDLQKAISINPRIPDAYGAIMNLDPSARGNITRESMLKNGLEENPNSFVIRQKYFFMLQPRWGGSFIDIHLFSLEIQKVQDIYPIVQRLLGYKDYVTAFNYQTSGDYRKAIQYFTNAVQYGEIYWVIQQRGIAYWQAKDYKNAIKDLSRAIELYPDDAISFAWRGIVYRDMGDTSSAILDFNASSNLQPYDFRTHMNRGLVYADLGQYNAAARDIQTSLYYTDDRLDAWYQLGWYLLYTRSQYKNAAMALKKAVLRDPNNPLYLYEYAVALNSDRDCSVTSIFDKFIALCKDSSADACRDETTKWVQETSSFLKQNQLCPSH